MPLTAKPTGAPAEDLSRPPAAAGVPLGLYVHVPFCLRRCGYCAFTTYAVDEVADDAAGHFVAAAKAEVALAAHHLGPERPELTSVYVGGGTPTLLDPDDLGRILDAVRAHLGLPADAEVTVEGNPDGLRPGQLERLRASGVTRVSFGMQSASPHVLAVLDRTHDPERAPVAVAGARAAGFEHVSLDLMYGTPGERPADWDRTLEVALGSGVDHLSAYALAVEPRTRLAARVRRGELPSPSEDDAAERYLLADRRCRDAGLRWYELSNWATDEPARCRHNLLYWRDHHWWGIGPGAHSHVAGLRWWNHSSLEAWAAAVGAGVVPEAGRERPTAEQAALERVMLGIRLAEGLDAEVVPAGPEAVDALVADELVRRYGDRVVLTPGGRLLADLVVRRLTG